MLFYHLSMFSMADFLTTIITKCPEVFSDIRMHFCLKEEPALHITDKEQLVKFFQSATGKHFFLIVDMDSFSKDEFYFIKTTVEIFNKAGKKISVVLVGENITYLKFFIQCNQTYLIKGWVYKKDGIFFCENKTALSAPEIFKNYMMEGLNKGCRNDIIYCLYE